MLNPNMDPTLRRERNSTRQLTSSNSTMGRGIGGRPMKPLTIAVAVAMIAPLPGLSHAMAGNHGKRGGAGGDDRELAWIAAEPCVTDKDAEGTSRSVR